MHRITLLLSIYCLSVSSGYLSGRMIVRFAPVSFEEDKRPLIPTIQIHGVRNGLLHGKIIGSARVHIGNTVLTQSGIFALDAGNLLKNEIDIVVPGGVQFVASKRGKKYYPVFSSAGERIVPKNRIYFATESDAKNAGYAP